MWIFLLLTVQHNRKNKGEKKCIDIFFRPIGFQCENLQPLYHYPTTITGPVRWKRTVTSAACLQLLRNDKSQSSPVQKKLKTFPVRGCTFHSASAVLVTEYTNKHWSYFTNISPQGNIEPLSTTVSKVVGPGHRIPRP